MTNPITGMIFSPGGFSNKEQEWVVWSDEVDTRNIVNCQPPLTGDCSKLEAFRNYQSTQASVVAFKYGQTLGIEGVALNSEGQIYIPSALTSRSSLFTLNCFEFCHESSQARKVEGSCALLTHHGPLTFGHIMADFIPRYWQIKRSKQKIDHWIIPRGMSQMYPELLDRLSISCESVVEVSKQTRVQAEILLVPARSGFAPHTAPWVRQAVIETLELDDLPTGQLRLWLSRSNLKRHWLQENEKQTLKGLEARGFQIARMEEETLDKQIKYATEAKVIAGPLGSGLTWCLAARNSDGLIFEVANRNQVHVDFQSLAQITGWRYGRTPSDTKNFNDDPISQSIDVSSAEVFRNLDVCLERIEQANVSSGRL